MKYVVEMSSDAKVETYIPSFIKIGSGNQILMVGGFTERRRVR
jgi:hypothetical protein